MRLRLKISHKLRRRIISFRRRTLPGLIFVGLVITLLLLLQGGLPQKYSGYFPEAKHFAGKVPTFNEMRDYLKELARVKGSLYAYQTLKVMELPPNTDFHLLGHIVSDQLYKEKGIEGMAYCTDDFRNACSHAMVVGIFADRGEAALPKITEACRSAPGGRGAYTMCFHGLGHGILSYFGYQMEKAVSLCEKAGPTAFPSTEASQCISGAVMEIISGGDHDHEVWQKQHDHYFAQEPNPLSLCQSSYMPQPSRPLCYLYLTPHLFVAAGGSLGNPIPALSKAFSFCEAIDPSNRADRDACFGGFGKEFVPLAQSRDIRKVEVMAEPQLKTVYNWCQLATASDGVLSCLSQALGSLYWGGENDVQASIRFCSLIDKTDQKNFCFNNLGGMVFYYKLNPTDRKNFCRQLPQPYQSQCERQIQAS